MKILKIGSYQLRNNLILAPMAGVSDRPFRELCTDFGSGMAVSEMLTSNTRLWNSRKSSLRLLNEQDPQPRAIQIAGSEPEQMIQAAQQCQSMGAQIIDINMGCPVKKVCNKAAGSALLKDETLVAKILQAVVSAVSVPVTLKIRTGWDAQHKNATRIGKIAENEGISALAIHGRTRADRFNNHAEYDTIAEVKQNLNIPVLANGDIDSGEKAKQVLDYTGVDGLLIGRAAQGRPWIFQHITAYLTTGVAPSPLTLGKIKEIISQHLAKIHAFYGTAMGVRIARKHVYWYLKDLPGAQAFRAVFNQLDSPEQQQQQLALFLHQLHHQGVEYISSSLIQH